MSISKMPGFVSGIFYIGVTAEIRLIQIETCDSGNRYLTNRIESVPGYENSAACFAAFIKKQEERMTTVNLNEMSLDELKALRKDVDAAIKNYESRKKKAALAELEAKAAELGFNLNDLTGSGGRSRKINPPKFRHPENPELTWSGRGRQPDWYKEQISAGRDPEDMKIAKS